MTADIGMVQATIGSVMAFDTEGAIRNLQVGDHVYANELISTGTDGAIEIEFADGEVMDLGRLSQVFLDSHFFDPTLTIATPEDSGQANSFLIDGQGDDILSGEHEATNHAQPNLSLAFPEDIEQLELSDVISNPDYQLAGFEYNGHLQIQVSNSEGIVQLIDLTSVAASDDIAAQSALNSILSSGIFDDGMS
jgi:hypothetical protein